MSQVRRWIVCITAGALAATTAAQAAPYRTFDHRVGVDSGIVRNANPTPAARGLPAAVWSTVVTVPGSSALRLRYAGVLLAGAKAPGRDGSFLRLTSLRDGHLQTQHLEHVAQWRETSAWFNGDAVLVELWAYPGTGDNRLLLGDAMAAPAIGGDSICGATDDRVLGSDPRCARALPAGCTAWIVDDCSHCLLTAGHCAVNGNLDIQVVEFNVPLSSASGTLVHPPPQHQYAVDVASKQSNGGVDPWLGDDWAYFGVFPNPITNLTPWQANGNQSFTLLPAPPPLAGQLVRVTGYGSTSAPVSPTWNVVQKTHAGPYAALAGTTVRCAVDTTGGNSGSPVFLDGTDLAFAIHNAGGCTATGGANYGTGTNHAGLRSALADPQGVCACPAIEFSFPAGLPLSVSPFGTTTLVVDVGGPVPLQPGTVRFHWSTGGSFQTLVPTPLGGNRFAVAVPAAACAATVRYYLSAQDPGNTTYTSPRQAPANVHAAITATTAVAIRTLDFATPSPGWSVTNQSLAAGGWERAMPADPGGPPTDFDGSGWCYVTGNAIGVDVDGGPTTLRSETLDLRGTTNPWVHYALWFHCSNVVDDVLLVEASGDGGANWTTLEIVSATEGWEVHGFRVLDHFSALDRVVVRWSTRDRLDDSNTEAALDAFRVDDVDCTFATFTTFGSGCPGGNGVPDVAATALPTLGRTWSLRAGNLAGGAAFLILGLARQNQPLQPFGIGFGSACTALVTPDAPRLLVQSAGTATWRTQLPNAPAFAGAHLYCQVVEIGTPMPAVSAGGDALLRF